VWCGHHLAYAARKMSVHHCRDRQPLAIIMGRGRPFQELASLSFVERCSGTGKTHLAIALGPWPR
jgi:hypothetical protein